MDFRQFYDKNASWVNPAVMLGSSMMAKALGSNTEGAGATIGNIADAAGSIASMIPGPIGMGIGAGLKLIGGVANAAFGYKLNKENINNIENNIKQQQSFTSNVGDFDSLSQNILSAPTDMSFNKNDVGKDGWFNKGATRYYNKLMKRQQDASDWIQNTLTNNQLNLQMSQAQGLRENYRAAGGPLFMKNVLPLSPFGNRFNYGGMSALATHGADWNNGLKFINVGGSHEENPYEGVQMGVDQEGTPNLVEEGEVIWNDYVFSNRMIVPKRVKEKLGIKGMNDITYAEVAKKIQKEAEERPNDPISKRGLDATLARLASSQEEDRMKKQQEEQEEQMLNMAAEGGLLFTDDNNEYSDGGKIHIKESKKGTFTKAATEHGMGVQEFASKVLANKDNYSPAMVKKANFAKNAAGWKHGLGGNLFPTGGPFGPLGGPKWYWDNYWKNFGIEEEPLYKQLAVQQGVSDSLLDKQLPPVKFPIVESSAKNIKLQNKYPNLNTTDNNKSWWDASYLRYAPVIGSAINVFTDLAGLTNKPDYSNADSLMAATQNLRDVRPPSIGDYVRYTPFDRMFYLNQLNANAGATRRGLMDVAGGNRGAAMAGLLASDYNTLGKIGELARQAEEYNLANRFKSAEFNRGTNQFNSEMDLKAQMANNQNASVKLDVLSKAAAIRDAIDARIGAARSANLTNFFDNLGNIGWEAANRNMTRGITRYELDRFFNPVYAGLGYGYNITPEEYNEIVERRKKADEDWKAAKSKKGTSSAYGGLLTYKRRK